MAAARPLAAAACRAAHRSASGSRRGCVCVVTAFRRTNNVVRPGPSVLHWHWLVGRAWGGGQRACHPPGPGPSTAMVEPASSMSALRRIIDMGVGRRTCRVKVVPSPGAAILPRAPIIFPGVFFFEFVSWGMQPLQAKTLEVTCFQHFFLTHTGGHTRVGKA